MPPTHDTACSTDATAPVAEEGSTTDVRRAAGWVEAQESARDRWPDTAGHRFNTPASIATGSESDNTSADSGAPSTARRAVTFDSDSTARSREYGIEELVLV